MPDLGAIERWPIERLLPYAANARTHPDEQIAQIAGSIAEFGFNVPCLVDERGVLIAGHGRLLAARKLHLAEVPVIRLDHLTDAQARAFRIADNQIAVNADWDEATLSAELARLKEDGFDLDLLGFPESELDRLLDGLGTGSEGRADENDVPEPPAEPVTQAGDLWLLGEHRLLCGDATVATDVERLIADVSPHLMVTDPPYGVDYDPAWRNEAGVSATTRTGKVSNDDRADWREAWALFPGDVAYVWHAGVHSRLVAESLEATGFAIRSEIIWAKPRFVLGRGDYHWQHEPCFYAVRKGATGHWQGGRDQSTLWTIPGCGERVYDPVIETRELGGGTSVPENAFSGQGMADWTVALDNLQDSLPSVGTVLLVVGWFGDDLRAGHCLVRPKVEVTSKTTTPDAWKVHGISRSGAAVVSTVDGRPAYGGSPSVTTRLSGLSAT